MKCDFCGKEESLPFVCNYCGGTYCPEHRLPEAHKCIGDLSRKRMTSGATTFAWGEGGYTMGRTRQPRTFSTREIRDILVAWVALSLAFTIAITGGGLGGFIDRIGVYAGSVVYVPVSSSSINEATCSSIGVSCLSLEVTILLALATIGVGFVLHELMHKFVAERYGFMAEFRMWIQGLAFALGFATLIGLVFAAPGATYIMGQGIDQEENGIISLAGPLTNVVIAVLFLPLLFFHPDNVLLVAGYLGSYFNFFLATFNMIPIYVLDGAKVWRWNKLYWAAVFIPLVIIVGAYLEGYAP